jgi:hypothetical protein
MKHHVEYGVQEDQPGPLRRIIYPKIEAGPKVVGEVKHHTPGTRIESALEEINNGLERSRRYAGGPKGAKRPADAIGNAIIIARIATGEIEDITTDDAKNAAAVALGRMGGKARAEGMSAKRRREIAQKAAEK